MKKNPRLRKQALLVSLEKVRELEATPLDQVAGGNANTRKDCPYKCNPTYGS